MQSSQVCLREQRHGARSLAVEQGQRGALEATHVVHEDVHEEVDGDGYPLHGRVLVHLDPAQEECGSMMVLVEENHLRTSQIVGAQRIPSWTLMGQGKSRLKEEPPSCAARGSPCPAVRTT